MQPPVPASTPGDGAPRSPAPRPIAWVDGRILPAADATVPLLDDGFLRGDAVFEAVLVRGGKTHALDPHLARLRRSAESLGIRLPVVRQVVADLLAAWGDRDGAIRLIVTRAGNLRGILGPARWPDALALATIDLPWRTALTGIKSLSYAANQLAIRMAQDLGADDALVVGGQALYELPTGALLLVHDGVVSTPDPRRLPILDSITVQQLQQVARVERTCPTITDLRRADEIFVMSATRPIIPVHAIHLPDRKGDGEDLTYPAPGPMTAELKARFEAHITATLDSDR